MTNWQEGDPLSPTNLNSRVPSWVSSNNTGVIFPSMVSGIFSPIINVQTDYGATNDGVTDNYAVLQNALDNAAAASDTTGIRQVYFPGGIYSISQPLWVTGNGTQLQGTAQGFSSRFIGKRGGATIIKPTFAGPAILVGSSDATVSNLTTSLVTGAGFAFDADNKVPYFNLRDSVTLDLNGLTAATVEGFFKTTFSADFAPLATSAGGFWVTGDSVTWALGLWNSLGRAELRIHTVTSGAVTVTDPATTLSNGSVHHVAGTYDGITARLFVDGVLVASSPASGAIMQDVTEEVYVGPIQKELPEQGQVFNPSRAICDSVRFSKTARYTAAFTAPTAKFANDANTLGLLNFDSSRGPMVRMETYRGDVWLVQRDYNAASVGLYGFAMQGIQVDGSSKFAIGLYFNGHSQHWSLEHCDFEACRTAIYALHHNHFQWHLTHCFLNSGITQARYGIVLGSNAGIGQVDTLWSNGALLPIVFGIGNITVNNAYLVSDGNMIGGFYLGNVNNSNGPVVLNGCAVDTESGSSTGMRAAVILSGELSTCGVHAAGCMFHNSANGSPFVLVGNQVETAVFSGCNFFTRGTVPSVLSGTPAAPVLFDKCTQTSWKPWSLQSGTAIVGQLGTYFSASTGSTLQFNASVYDNWDVTLNSDVTQSSWTKISYGQPVSGAIKMDSTGSRLFTWPTNSKGTATLSYGSAAVNTFAGFYDGVNVILTSVRTGL